MARKIGLYGILAYFLYGLFFYWYLFYFADTSLPFEYQGTSADPATFLNGREFVLTEEYSKIRNLMFFLSTPFEWFLYPAARPRPARRSAPTVSPPSAVRRRCHRRGRSPAAAAPRRSRPGSRASRAPSASFGHRRRKRRSCRPRFPTKSCRAVRPPCRTTSDRRRAGRGRRLPPARCPGPHASRRRADRWTRGGRHPVRGRPRRPLQ